MRTHNDEKLFKCYICAMSFKVYGHLGRHMWIHTQENPKLSTQVSTKMAPSIGEEIMKTDGKTEEKINKWEIVGITPANGLFSS